jgi:uncharacterized membrane protein
MDVYRDTLPSTARLFGRPLHPMLVPVPIVCFAATFVTDIVYWRTAAMMWADVSAWLLAVGLFISVLVVLAGLVDFLAEPRIRALPTAWIHAAGNGLVIVLSILNAFVHSRDAYTSVVPEGLILSGVVVLLLLVTAWAGWSMTFVHGVGVGRRRRR